MYSSGEQDKICKDACKNPDKYKGCYLCFGIGHIGSKCLEEFYICPKCKNLTLGHEGW